jgi:hypothetical protein
MDGRSHFPQSNVVKTAVKPSKKAWNRIFCIVSDPVADKFRARLAGDRVQFMFCKQEVDYDENRKTRT